MREVDAQQLVDAWNERYPVGTPVRYLRPGNHESNYEVQALTKGRAYALHGAAMIQIHGRHEPIFLELLDPCTPTPLMAVSR